MKAAIREIFSSVQGEGPYVGLRQIFLRFAGCNLSCRYCDTVKALYGERECCQVEVDPGTGIFEEILNPLSVDEVVDIVTKKFPLPLHHSVSLTGGEPLLQADFLMDLLPPLRKLGTAVYLETNGTLFENLVKVIRLVDIVSMDIKLPGTAGCSPMWDSHLQFLSIAKQAGVFVKIVMDDSSSLQEYEKALELVAGVDREITLVIQPMTSGSGCSLSPGRALELQAVGLKKLKDVRVIPQAHVMMNQL